jgi:signal transduction histidine kinase/CheY-like chemotaxis protein
LLAEQNAEVERKNLEVETARGALEDKATQLALTSKYKSEFMANMSHELRTPLNSLLILSDQLAKNVDSNLTPRQVEFAQTIHASGNDLLSLINDILDLSKVESGTVVLDVADVAFRDLHDYVERAFRHVAEAKKLGFSLSFDAQLPTSLRTDAKRLQQVIKNLLANAFKFTDKGAVSLHVAPAASGWSPENESLGRAASVIALTVADTGIGIPPDKQQIIFEAFQQADGSTSRKYGGTGLGLTISRELAALLGGEIRLNSTLGKGSEFTLYLPQSYFSSKPLRQNVAVVSAAGSALLSHPDALGELEPDELKAAAPWPADVSDDRAHLLPTDRVLLVVENDLMFARLLLEAAHEQGLKAVVAGRGAEGLILARKYRPYAVTLDMHLPDMDGWRVLTRLKEDLQTRHIPVYVITTEEDSDRGLRLGALGALNKPLKSKDELGVVFSRFEDCRSGEPKILLVVGPEDERRSETIELVAGGDVRTIAASAGEAATEALAEQRPACVVATLCGPDASALDFLEELGKRDDAATLPAIAYVLDELSTEDERRLKRLAQRMLLKQVRSPERLVDEAALFLHRTAEQLAPPKRDMLKRIHEPQAVLTDKTVLVVDDDIRNIFAMSCLLERHGMHTVTADTGIAALERLADGPPVDVVLMDIMMPTMDGYDTIRAIRASERFGDLPIIALTAKAMKGDREKCLQAGASDYIAKPVDTDYLLAMLQVWLHR